MDVTLRFDASLDSSLDLKAILLEEGKLLHQSVLLLDHLLVVLCQFFSVFATHLQLGLKLTHLLCKLVPLKLATSRFFNGLTLLVTCRLERGLDMTELKQLPLHLQLLALSLQKLVLLGRQLLRQDLLLIDHDVEVLLSGHQLPVLVLTVLLESDDLVASLLQQALSLVLSSQEELAIVHFAI